MSNTLIFDLGYNVGNFTQQALNLYPDAKIIGVEGHPIYLDMFRSSPIPNVELIHAVVSNEGGKEIPFYICDSNPGINSINLDWIAIIRHSHFFDKTKREIMVRAITIDSLIEKYGVPDIIKMDIEGAESIALRGLSQKCGLITFEWSEEFFKDTKICVELLKNLGYTLFAYTEENDQFSPHRYFTSWEDLNIEANIIPSRKHRWGMMYAV